MLKNRPTAMIAFRQSAVEGSPLRQLEFDATVAPIGFLGRAAIDGLKLAKSGRNEPGWFHALADQLLNH